MTARRIALWGLVLLWGWSGFLPARAADRSNPRGGLDGGSSSREARQRAVEALPVDSMSDAGRHAVEECLRRTTLYRRLPTATIGCDAALLDFVLAKPETLVDVWRVLGISRLTLDPTGPGQWRLADGYGTAGSVRLLHRERNDRGGLYVFHGRGGYSGPLSPRDLSGSCVILVRYARAVPDDDGRPRQTVQIDAFLDVDGLGLEIVTRTLQPLIVRSAAANLHEIGLFVSQFAAAAARNPAGVARLADRMTRTTPEDRQALVALAGGSRATPMRDGGLGDDAVQAELAARWLPADEAAIAGAWQPGR
jgi:hypothetical protein